MKHAIRILLISAILLIQSTSAGALSNSFPQNQKDVLGFFIKETIVLAGNNEAQEPATAPKMPAVVAKALGALAKPQQKVFKTKFSSIYYKDEKDIDDFIWRLGGQRLEYTNDPQLASSRIDRLVNRVQMILDMWPKNFKIDIFLHRGSLKANKRAYYENKTNSIHICVDHTSDGVMAHELAHANIYHYFPTPPPSKLQEILAQYVDQHLWSDY